MLEKTLIATGVVLIIVNSLRIRKENKKSFKNALEIEKLNRESKKDFEIEFLNEEIEKLKKKVETINIKTEEKIVINNNQKANLDNNEVITDNSKQNKIKTLLDLGYSDEEICKDLNIGKGELQLIKKIYN